MHAGTGACVYATLTSSNNSPSPWLSTLDSPSHARARACLRACMFAPCTPAVYHHRFEKFLAAFFLTTVVGLLVVLNNLILTNMQTTWRLVHGVFLLSLVVSFSKQPCGVTESVALLCFVLSTVGHDAYSGAMPQHIIPICQFDESPRCLPARPYTICTLAPHPRPLIHISRQQARWGAWLRVSRRGTRSLSR